MYGEQHTAATGERTVAQRIYFDRYWVHVAELHFRTEVDLAVNGRYVNDKITDRQLMMNKIRIYIPIAGMCQYLEEGVIVELDDPRQSVAMYKLLMEHLQNWAWLSSQLNAPVAPIDDLRVMDRFAELLFPVASIYQKIDQTTQKGGLFGRIQELSSGGVVRSPNELEQRQLSRPRFTDGEEQSKDSASAVPHNSLSSIIARQTFKNPWTS